VAADGGALTVELLEPLDDVSAYDGSASAAWGVDEAAPLLTIAPACAASLVLVPELEYCQRANPDRIADPHGEHAVEVWLKWGEVG